MIKKYETFVEKRSMWNIIPNSVKELHLLFKNSGKDLFVVGGAVRDFLNGEKPKDFDLCTNAHPDDILKILGNKYRTNLQGKSFGVVVVYTKDQPMGMEIATFREDMYNDKQLGNTRNPDVKFSTIEKDVERRDITYNSLFFDLDKGEIVDLIGGVKDLEEKMTRFVGDPSLRIKEDPLRIMRLLRFNCRYQFTIDAKAAKAIISNKSRLKIIPRERIWDIMSNNPGEIKKAWEQSKDFSEYLELFNRFDMWEDIFPGLMVNKNINKSKYLEVYLANILVDNDSDKLLKILVEEYKIDTTFARKIVFLISLLKLNTDNVKDIYKGKTISGLSDDIITEWYRIRGLNDKMFIAFLKFKPSVNSQELMDNGFKGQELGEEIKRLETEKFKQLINED